MKKNNKSNLWRFFLVLLPLLAGGMEGFPNSVRYWSSADGGVIQYCTFYQLIEGVNFAILLPITAFLTITLMVMALVYAIKQKESLIPTMLWISFLTLILSTVPTIIPSDPKVLPDVIISLLLLAETVLIWYVKGHPLQKTNSEPTGKRLDSRKK